MVDFDQWLTSPKNHHSSVNKVANNGCNGGGGGTKRNLAQMNQQTTSFNGSSGGQKRKQNNTISGKSSLAAEPSPQPSSSLPPPPPTFSVLNCDLDATDLNEDQAAHLKLAYKQATQKAKTLQDTELALARRLSAAQKSIEVLRAKKTRIAKAMTDFTQICRDSAQLNAEPLSAGLSEADAINAYLERIALISQQRDSSEEAEAHFTLVKEQLMDFWQEMLMQRSPAVAASAVARA